MTSTTLQLRAKRLSGLSQTLRSCVLFLATASAVARQRRELADLDERTLKDIGVSRVDALREARRAFWDLPPKRLEANGESRYPRSQTVRF